MGVELYGLGLTKSRLDCGTTLYGNIGGPSGALDGAIHDLVEAAFCR